MGGIGGQYGPYVMYVLSQLLQKRQAMGKAGEPKGSEEAEEKRQSVAGREQEEQSFFSRDETRALWHREENTELLKQFCREGYAQAKKHGHFIIGTCADTGAGMDTGKGTGRSFIGIPGRFLIEEQPAGGVTGFTLWQPLRGGEELYDSLEEMEQEEAQRIFGYWIAAIDEKTLKISEV